MSWKEEFHNAVKNYINENHNLNATEVTDVYDAAYTYDNSMGYSSVR